MKKVRLVDGSFSHQKSLTLGSENSETHPSDFHWARGLCESEYSFFTDMTIQHAPDFPGKKVALLCEPPSLSDTHYHKAKRYIDEFEYVLSFWVDYLDEIGDKGLFYPLGGSWISPETQGIKKKSRNVCIIVSQKVGAEGHRMRHSTVSHFSERLNIDVYGRGYKPFESKGRVLWPYRYAIVIESWTGTDYFSEKLIDAISMGCVPIYCGCPNIGKYFNKNGILTFDNLAGLEQILTLVVSEHDYRMRMDAIEDNFHRATQYQCAEDWMYDNYGFLFT